MAITLTGCVNFTTGLVEIDDNVCHWTGCLVFSGTHSGQVALSPNTTKCPDTYYGCVAFPGGTFSVVVPESCCPCTEGSCCDCWGCSSESTPTEMEITYQGIGICGGGLDGSILNGTHILDLDETQCDCGDPETCEYNIEVPESYQIKVLWVGPNQFQVEGYIWTGFVFIICSFEIVSKANRDLTCEEFKVGSTDAASWTTEGIVDCNA